MQLVATDKFRLSQTVKYELEPGLGFTREVLTYNGAAKTFNIGDLVAADGTVPATAGDIYGVVIETKTAALNTDTSVLVLERGPAILSKAGITLGSLAAADVYTALAAKNIKVSDAN